VDSSKEMNFYDIILEGDALQIVNAVKDERKRMERKWSYSKWNQRRNTSTKILEN
jgi:Cdc6-like AAA superfamily ATPase